jgi:hypothetical protein
MPFRLKDSSQAALKRLADTVVNNLGVKRGGKDPGIFSRRCGETLVVVVVVDVRCPRAGNHTATDQMRCWMFNYENYLNLEGQFWHE